MRVKNPKISNRKSAFKYILTILLVGKVKFQGRRDGQG